MDSRPVGMFDSGAGGLSVLQAFRSLAPNEHTIYFADTAYFPYGPRPAAEVRKRSFAIVHKLLQYDVKMVVVACNTASAAAIADLREAFDIPFVGMVPGVKPGASVSKSKRVVILATSGTMDGDLYNRVVEEFGRGTTIRHLHNDALAQVVEAGCANSQVARDEVRAALDAEVRAGADTVVLGCTHFHFLAGAIHAEYPGLALIDTSEAVARRAVQVLTERDELAPPDQVGHLDVIVSGDRERFRALAESLGVTTSTAGGTG